MLHLILNSDKLFRLILLAAILHIGILCSAGMDDRQESSLIEIMVCCVKQAATGEYPVGRGPTRKLTAKEQRQVQEDKIKLTDHFIVKLPQLLAKVSFFSCCFLFAVCHPSLVSFAKSFFCQPTKIHAFSTMLMPRKLPIC